MKTETNEKNRGSADAAPRAKAPRRGRRPGGEVSGRGALLAAAQKLFSRSGFAGASLREVAREAEVAPALLMHEVDPGRAADADPEDGARFNAVTEKLIHPFRTASLPLIRRALDAGVIRGSSPELVFSLLMGAASATLLAPEIAGGARCADEDFRARTAEVLLALVLR